MTFLLLSLSIYSMVAVIFRYIQDCESVSFFVWVKSRLTCSDDFKSVSTLVLSIDSLDLLGQLVVPGLT